jgi:hypothetical protein
MYVMFQPYSITVCFSNLHSNASLYVCSFALFLLPFRADKGEPESDHSCPAYDVGVAHVAYGFPLCAIYINSCPATAAHIKLI